MCWTPFLPFWFCSKIYRQQRRADGKLSNWCVIIRVVGCADQAVVFRFQRNTSVLLICPCVPPFPYPFLRLHTYQSRALLTSALLIASQAYHTLHTTPSICCPGLDELTPSARWCGAKQRQVLMRREEQLRQLRGQVLNSVVEIVVESAGVPLLQEGQLMKVA